MHTKTRYQMENKRLRPLAFSFFASGIWDTIAAMLYFFVIGIGRKINNPAIDPFFAIFLGSFFICFAYTNSKAIIIGIHLLRF